MRVMEFGDMYLLRVAKFHVPEITRDTHRMLCMRVMSPKFGGGGDASPYNITHGQARGTFEPQALLDSPPAGDPFTYA